MGREGVDSDVLQESFQSAAESDDVVVVRSGLRGLALSGMLGQSVGELRSYVRLFCARYVV